MRRHILFFILLLFIITALISTSFLITQRQDIRNRASEEVDENVKYVKNEVIIKFKEKPEVNLEQIDVKKDLVNQK